jgi:ribonuclease HI
VIFQNNPHIDNKLKNAKKSLKFLTQIAGKFWGPSPRLTHWVYTGIVRPALTYGSLVWAPKTNTKIFKIKAQRLQRLALISLGPVRLHSPTIGLEIATNTMPLHLYVENCAMSTYLRLTNLLTKTIITKTRDPTKSHIVWARKMLSDAGLLGVKSDRILTNINYHQPWSLNLNSYDPILDHTPNALQAFTDGSKMNDKVGSGLVIHSDDNPIKIHFPIHFACEYLGKMATVFQAEVYAIIMATASITTIIPTLTTKPKLIQIISDSKSALQALDRPTTNSSLILECKNALTKLHNIVPIQLRWIRAHVGHAGNELADQWAKKGTNTTTAIVEPFLPLSTKWIKTKLHSYSLTKWADRWNSVATARQTKIFFPKPNIPTSRALLRLDRETFGLAFRWLSGHNYLLRHCNLLDPVQFPNPTCRLCHYEPETSSHLLNSCPALATKRYSIFGAHILNETPPWTVSQLLNMIKTANDRCPEILPHEY